MSVEKTVQENRQDEYELRTFLADAHNESKFYIDTNPDVREIPHYRGCFSKSLPHDDDGIPDPEEVRKIIRGVRKDHSELDKIEYAGKMRLVNPSCIYSLDLTGPFKSSLPIKLTPSASSAEAAADMVELYNMALLRDVPFSEWHRHADVKKAIRDLNKLSDFTGPKEDDRVTLNTLFRGNSQGDLKGPYVSQFLLQPFTYGICDVDQKYRCAQPHLDFMTHWDTVLSVQNGVVTEVAPDRKTQRYIITLRDLCTYVHLDDPLQCGLYASLVLNSVKCPIVKCKTPEGMFVDLGGLDMHDLMCRSVRVSMLSAWYHKWNTLKIRPEVMGMEVHRALLKKDEETFLHCDLLESPVLKRIYAKYKSYLLPQAYPEGSPCHPSYPAGHSVFAGAMTTILKAFYDENFEFDAVIPNADGSKLLPSGHKLRVGDELDKLASNIAIARNAAGVHYRSDSTGIELGEEVAIEVLKDAVKRYCRQVTFKFHRRNGEVVEIKN